MSDDNKDLKTLIEIATKGLQDKNRELLKKLKDQSKLTEKFKDIDVEELLTMKDKFEEIQKEKDEQSGDYKKLYEKQQEEHQKALDAVTLERDGISNELKTLHKKVELTKELNTHHVDPVMQDAALSLLLPEIKTTDEGSFVVADKPLTEHIKEWVVSDLGKRFVLEGNSGGGAGGPGGKANVEAEYFNPKSDSYNVTKQAEIARKSPEMYKKYKEQYKSA